MSRSIKAVAGAAALLCLGLAGQAHAQSTVNVYGLVDAAAGRFQLSGEDAVSRVESGNMTTSFLGFSGKEELGGGLKAVFAVETFLRADEGRDGRFNGDRFWARNAYVGIETSYGTYQFGRTTTTMFVSTLAFNAFGDSFAFSPSILQVLTPHPAMPQFFGDTGWSNSALFSSKSFGGVSFNLQTSLGEDAAGSNGNNVGGSIVYAAGPLAATVSYSRVKNGVFGAPAGFENQETAQVGASYDFGVAKLFGQYTQVETDATANQDSDIWGLGASVPLGGGKLLAQYGHSKAEVADEDATNKTLSLGYDYSLSKRTDVYAVYMRDKVTGLDTGNTYAVGIRHRF